MSTLSYDGQSMIIDGRRIWLVSGSIHYPRVPSGLWRQRVRAARQAGLNCIETFVFWNVHEPKAGVYDFTGEADLRQFVQILADEGMYCILRPGPYIGADWDFGGLPPWLLPIADIKLRQASGPFMEACARYMGKVMDQVRDLQVTPPTTGGASGRTLGGGGGPILMVQVENEWLCHNPEQADSYLRELVRYLRENGCTVPINVCNNLWQRVDGAFDTWNARDQLTADLRQLRVVQPSSPRIVTEYWPGAAQCWGSPPKPGIDASGNSFRLAQILAAGGQYNLYMFHGGTNFAFWGGRSIASGACFTTTSYDCAAPLSEGGGRSEKYFATKRISTFASQFGHVLAHLDPDRQHVAAAPGEQQTTQSIIHQRGSQGEIIFILKGGDDRSVQTQLLLPSGRTLTVPHKGQRVAWVLLNANLGGVAQLSYSSLCPWAFLGKKILALFGPPGTDGVVCINDAPLQVHVPEGKDPLVESHEGITVVVLNHEQVDAAYQTATGLVVGAHGLDADDLPVPQAGFSQFTNVDFDGEIEHKPARTSKPTSAPTLGGWKSADLEDYLSGAGGQFRAIDGPQSLEKLHCSYGYGWYRFNAKSTAAAKISIGRSGDRLHFFRGGKHVALLGVGPGAQHDPASLSLDGRTVVLADNLGRFDVGRRFGEAKGLLDPLLAVKPVKLAKPKHTQALLPDPFSLSGFVLFMRRGPVRSGDWLTWPIKANKMPMVLELQGLPLRAIVVVNDTPLGLYDPQLSAGATRFLLQNGQQLRTGRNDLKLALLDPYDGKTDASRFVHLYQGASITNGKSDWGFAPWKVPAAEEFNSAVGAKTAAGKEPAWFRCQFKIKHTDMPLWLDAQGLSKGQILLNGRNVGRYFVATAGGDKVGPQIRYYLPEPWLKRDEANELILFDEHGHSPARCKLVYTWDSPIA